VTTSERNVNEAQAYLNGRYVPTGEAVLPVRDGGFVQGTTVAEQLRTFGGRLFRLQDHIQRLSHSLAIVKVDPRHTAAKLTEIAETLVARNHPLLAPGDDLGLAMFVTPGDYGAMSARGAAPTGPTVCLHTFPLRFDLWADKYRVGQALATTDVVQVSERSWPVELKCRSRMHYFLADHQAQARYPGSRAVMLDDEGYVTESTTANIVLYRAGEGLLTPPRHKILPGISLAVLAELAAGLSLPLTERDLKPADIAGADEVYLTSTSPCMVPVTRFNGQPIGAGKPGTMFQKLIAEWSRVVGLDIVAQAERFSR
jgi:branched-subunit amino acid aminotransferase/4-amino-4-deoxychorismate lyase